MNLIKIEYEWIRRAFMDAETPVEKDKAEYLLKEHSIRPVKDLRTIPASYIPEKTLLAIMEHDLERRNRLQVMPTTDPALRWLLESVRRMKVGQRLAFHKIDMEDIATLHHRGCVWTPADRVIENVLGGAYCLSYRVDRESGTVTFMRHPENTGRHYLSPDHPERREDHYVY